MKHKTLRVDVLNLTPQVFILNLTHGSGIY